MLPVSLVLKRGVKGRSARAGAALASGHSTKTAVASSRARRQPKAPLAQRSPCRLPRGIAQKRTTARRIGSAYEVLKPASDNFSS